MDANVSLEQRLLKQKEKMDGSEEQLRKLEQKVSLSDISLANQASYYTNAGLGWS